MSLNIDFYAAILEKQQAPLAIHRISSTSDLKCGQVLVKLKYSGICGSQIGEIMGKKGPDRYLPHLLGHEGCGEAIAIGPGVTRIKEKDKVVLHWMKSQGIQAETPSYIYKDPLNSSLSGSGQQNIQAGYVTTFNEYALVSENRLTPIPNEFPEDFAALMGCAVTTGLGIVQHNLIPKLGASMLIIGTGGVGLSVIAGAALMRCSPIIAIDQTSDRLGIAKQMGAQFTINTSISETISETNTPTDERSNFDQIKQEIRDIVGSQGIDYVAECTGNPQLIELAMDITHPQGTCLLAGVAPHDQPPRLNVLDLLLGKKLQGSFGGSTKPEADIPRYIKMVESQALNLNPMMGEKIALTEINDGIQRMMEGKSTGRTLIQFDQPTGL